MPVPQEVRDIGSVDELLRYAAAGQLDRLLDDLQFLNNGLVGQGAGFGKNKRRATEALSRALSNGFRAELRIPIESDHLFRSISIADSGVFDHLAGAGVS
jgi:hypothetical protein